MEELPDTGPKKSFTIDPVYESFTTSTGQTIKGATTITNDGETTLNFIYDFIPYSYELDTFYGSKDIELEEPWLYYNKIVEWATIDSGVTSLAPGESGEVNYSITIPSCSPSDYQWLALLIEAQDTYYRTAELMEVTIEDNEASECGGTADDPYPYVEIKYIDNDGSVVTGLTKFDSKEAEEYEEEKEEIESYEQTIVSTNQTIGTITDNMPLIIGATVGAIVFAALIIILVKTLTKKKSNMPKNPTSLGSTPGTTTPPASPSTPLTPTSPDNSKQDPQTPTKI